MLYRYKLLLSYTEVGISQIQNTTDRAAQFRQAAHQLGVTIEEMFWTLGDFDGIVTLSGEDEEKIIALVTHLARKGYVRTCLLRAFTEEEFGHMLAQMPKGSIELEA